MKTELPVYLMVGFLDAGKTSFINDILSDGFADKDNRTLLLRCEEGEEEYNPQFMRNVTVVDVEDASEINPVHLSQLEDQYQPKQILIEYNGMWPMENMNGLPENWVLYQIMTFVDASSFDLYTKNFGQLMMEKIINTDMIIFNHCTPELKESLRARNLRMVNRSAVIYLEDEDGGSEDYLTGDEEPFDLSQDPIVIPDDDFGIWYVDVMDHMERYENKTVRLKMVMCHSKNYPGIDCPGRFVMVCCANDIQFMGIMARGEQLAQFNNRDWLDITAKVTVEDHPAYEGPGPVLNIISAVPCEKAANEVVTF